MSDGLANFNVPREGRSFDNYFPIGFLNEREFINLKSVFNMFKPKAPEKDRVLSIWELSLPHRKTPQFVERS